MGEHSLVLGKLLHPLKQVSSNFGVQILSNRCTVRRGGLGHGEGGIGVLRCGARGVVLAIAAQRCTGPCWGRTRRISWRHDRRWRLNIESTPSVTYSIAVIIVVVIV